MWKCGNYVEPDTNDCHYKDDRCCWYCDKKWSCHASVKCWFDCYDDDNDNEDDVNAYWEDLYMSKWILIEVQNHDIEEPDTYDSYELAYEEMEKRFNKHKENEWECNIHSKYASIQSDFANWDWMIYEVKY